MEQLRASDALLPVIVMTAWSSVAGAVEAMRRGARDYVEKPWSDDRLLATLRTHIDLRRALGRSERLEEATARSQRSDTPVFIGDSPAIRDVRLTLGNVGIGRWEPENDDTDPMHLNEAALEIPGLRAIDEKLLAPAPEAPRARQAR